MDSLLYMSVQWDDFIWVTPLNEWFTGMFSYIRRYIVADIRKPIITYP